MLLSGTKPGVFLVLGVFLGTVAIAQDLRESLFRDADAALDAAIAAKADILAPTSYGEAFDLYTRAEKKLERGSKMQGIRADLATAVGYFQEATAATELAEFTLTAAIEARDDASSANAAEFAGAQWRTAESQFKSAASRLESGKIESARKRAAEAEQLYRTAELVAIKANYLDEARRLIAQAKSEKVERYAPATLANAEALLADADLALNENRYDTDKPRTLARQAKVEAGHAIYLSRLIQPVRDKDRSLEELALYGEQPLLDLADALEIPVTLDQGFATPVSALKERIAELQGDSVELGEKRAELLELETEIQRLERSLGSQSDKLAEQERQRQLSNEIEAMFNVNEAQVFRQGQNVLVRLIGLNFASGSAEIEAANFPLLSKVQQAVRKIPKSNLIIEGHTDSFGGDEANMRLSQERADSVRSYMVANMPDIPAASIRAVGLGESRPVASNETADGRRKNRRIDLLIRPM